MSNKKLSKTLNIKIKEWKEKSRSLLNKQGTKEKAFSYKH